MKAASSAWARICTGRSIISRDRLEKNSGGASLGCKQGLDKASNHGATAQGCYGMAHHVSQNRQRHWRRHKSVKPELGIKIAVDHYQSTHVHRVV